MKNAIFSLFIVLYFANCKQKKENIFLKSIFHSINASNQNFEYNKVMLIANVDVNKIKYPQYYFEVKHKIDTINELVMRVLKPMNIFHFPSSTIFNDAKYDSISSVFF